ncbi:DUF3080 domain-containing protein [Marinomonas balearica]|uniref:DUF3080 family protein n=1 Tax=Marinomonas balearica TaxID=491947 RepID=A0A4V3CGL5_9GAMM|nr:DUF3080 domain-containing protein [Marinomonas balearica]TDO98212.1 DUF3080 family protein [Marinomonas balearica]
MLSFRSVLVFIASFLMSSCDDRFRPIEHLESYHEALARSKLIKFASVQKEPTPHLISLPNLRDRVLPLSQFDIGLLDFLSLQRCEVGVIAGEKNSILGRVMPTSQRFVYELKIIKAIESCSVGNESLINELNIIAKAKRTELPNAFSNALWAGEEAEAFFSLSNGMIPMSPELSQYQELIRALEGLVIIKNDLQSLPNVTSKAFEAHMKAVLDSEYGGKLLVTLKELVSSLEYIAKAVESIHANSSNCQAPVRYLKQQFTKYYVTIIQPYMARINRVAYQVLPYINELREGAQGVPEQLTLFLAQFDEAEQSVWGRYKNASIRHARAWSGLFQQCGIRPAEI